MIDHLGSGQGFVDLLRLARKVNERILQDQTFPT